MKRITVMALAAVMAWSWTPLRAEEAQDGQQQMKEQMKEKMDKKMEEKKEDGGMMHHGMGGDHMMGGGMDSGDKPADSGAAAAEAGHDHGAGSGSSTATGQ